MPGGTDVGTGLTLVFASGETFEITDFSWDGPTTELHESSHHGSTLPDASNKRGGVEFIADVMENAGNMTFEHNLNPSVLPPLGTKQVVTVTYKTHPDDTNPASVTGTGICHTSSQNVPHKGKKTGSFQVQWSGVITFTAGS